MDSTVIIQIIILFILLLLSAFFSSSETALTCVNPVRIRSLAEDGDKRARLTEKILENPGKMLSTILIGNNIVNISATSLSTTLIIRVFGSYAVGIATGILTILILLFGEIIPKTSSNLYPEKQALRFCYPIWGLMFILTPLIFLVNKLSSFFLRLFGLNPSIKDSGMTENELKTYVDVSHEEGVIETEEREMILNVFDLGDSLARDIMIPRIDMTMISVSASYRSLQALFKETMYSRIPVYEEETDNIIGVVTLKDFFLASRKTDFHIREILRDTYYTYETKKTADLLNEMRQSANSIAIVLDEYGATVGLITLEDLLEEIVGEIRDEYDEEEQELIQEIKDHTYKVEGSLKVDDLNDALGTLLDSEDYDSIGGIMIEQLDRLPFEGESITLPDGIRLTAGKIIKNRISYVILQLPDSEETTSEQAENKADNEDSFLLNSDSDSRLNQDT